MLTVGTMIPVPAGVLYAAVTCARHVYRTTDDPGLRAKAAAVLHSLPAWMQQDEFRPPKEFPRST